jgi:hypothetical protein
MAGDSSPQENHCTEPTAGLERHLSWADRLIEEAAKVAMNSQREGASAVQ